LGKSALAWFFAILSVICAKKIAVKAVLIFSANWVQLPQGAGDHS
jgi:hypothetical protein